MEAAAGPHKEDRMALVTNNPTITLEAAAKAIRVALGSAQELGVKVSIHVLDQAGLDKCFVRMDGSPIIAQEASRRIAYPALLGRSTKHLAATYKDDQAVRDHLGHNCNTSLLQGGHPFITAAGDVLGSIGVAGATEQDNELVALAAVQSVEEQYKQELVTGGAAENWLQKKEVDRILRHWSLD